jgi:CRP/FNR family transcriptional regulator, cyclic AMP receptor protein
MSITSAPLDKVLTGPALVEHETRISVLRGCEFFSDLTSAELNTLAGFVELRAFRAGERVFLEGDSATWMAFVVDGKFSITKEGTSQQPVAVTREFKSRILGEMALLDGENRSATCTTASVAKLIVMSSAEFERMSNTVPGLALKILRDIAKLVSRRLRVASGMIVEAAS